MSTLVVEYLHRRYTVKTTPAMTVADVLSSVCCKLTPPLDSARCSLVRGNCTLEASLSVRLANLPSGTKLKLVAEAHASETGSSQGGSDIGVDTRQATPNAISEDASAAGQQIRDQLSHTVDYGPCLAAEEQASSGEPSRKESGERGVFLFHRDSLAAGRQDDQADLPDDFYDVTVEDMMTMVAGYEAARRKLERGLMTSAMREAEQRQAAAEVGPVLIRFQFSDGVVLQSSFAATELVEALYELLGRHVLEDFRPKLELTARPKQALKDRKMSLLQANLAPAAYVSVSIAGECAAGEVVLRQQVLEMKGDPPNWLGQHDASQIADSQAVERAPQQACMDGSKVQSRKGVPKWMKLGK